MCSRTEKAYVILVSSCIIDVVPLLSHHVIFNFLLLIFFTSFQKSLKRLVAKALPIFSCRT